MPRAQLRLLRRAQLRQPCSQRGGRERPGGERGRADRNQRGLEDRHQRRSSTEV